jgi:hypothetical protein
MLTSLHLARLPTTITLQPLTSLLQQLTRLQSVTLEQCRAVSGVAAKRELLRELTSPAARIALKVK